MKKLFLSFGVGLSFSFMYAQKMEVAVGYGTVSMYGVTNDLGTAISSTFIGENTSTPSSNGALNISAVIYNNNMRWRYGLDYVAEFYNTKGTNYTRKSSMSIMPKVDYFWSDANKKFRLYSGVSIGIYSDKGKYRDITTKMEEKFNNTHFAFNVTPIGFRYGGNLGLFLESNIGTKSIIQGGVSYMF
ncbi:hypothetical protein CMT48_13915 [Elizabethkingia anophelis]|nr:hypothetical protein [Elizabethkingia anophelis]